MVTIKKYWLVVVASSAVIAVIGYGIRSQRFVGRFPAGPEVLVRVVAARKTTAPAAIEAVGQLEATNETVAVSRLPGVVKDVRVRIGELIQKGEVVAVLQSKEWRERLRSNETAVKVAAANLQEMKTRLEDTEKKLAMIRDLYRKDLIARHDVEETEKLAATRQAEKERAQAELAQRRAALAQTRYLVGLTEIVAPATGRVTRRFAEPGTSVAPFTRILSIADPALMRVSIKIPALEAHRVHPGIAAAIRIAGLPGKLFTGKVSKVAAAVEGKANLSTAEIRLRTTDGALKPGLEAFVSLALPEEGERVMIPNAAIFDLHGKPYVYVVRQHQAQARNIDTGAQESGETIVKSNLAAGEKVVVAGRSRLRSDSYVRIVE
jgi:RND family efflux transporter MFP subunit